MLSNFFLFTVDGPPERIIRFIKLKFTHNKEMVGWSISLCTKLNNHKQFGNMLLGSIVDLLSLKNYEAEIVN